MYKSTYSQTDREPRRTTTDDDDSDDEPSIASSPSSVSSAYERKPDTTNPFWRDARLAAHTGLVKYFRGRAGNEVLTTETEVVGSKLKFKGTPAKTYHYVQFAYKTPALLSVFTNVYGLLVSTADNWKNKYAVTSAADLTGRHRVSILCASTKHWWHEPSRLLMDAFVNRFTDDMKALVGNEGFLNALETFGLKTACGDRVRSMREKIQTGVSTNGAQERPGVFGIKVHNAGNRLTGGLGFIETGGVIRASDWNALLPAKHVHAALIIRVDGFKITRHGFSIDMTLDDMVYENQCPITAPGRGTTYVSSDEEEEAAVASPPLKRRRIDTDW